MVSPELLVRTVRMAHRVSRAPEERLALWERWDLLDLQDRWERKEPLAYQASRVHRDHREIRARLECAEKLVKSDYRALEEKLANPGRQERQAHRDHPDQQELAETTARTEIKGRKVSEERRDLSESPEVRDRTVP